MSCVDHHREMLRCRSSQETLRCQSQEDEMSFTPGRYCDVDHNREMLITTGRCWDVDHSWEMLRYRSPLGDIDYQEGGGGCQSQQDVVMSITTGRHDVDHYGHTLWCWLPQEDKLSIISGRCPNVDCHRQISKWRFTIGTCSNVDLPERDVQMSVYRRQMFKCQFTRDRCSNVDLPERDVQMSVYQRQMFKHLSTTERLLSPQREVYIR